MGVRSVTALRLVSQPLHLEQVVLALTRVQVHKRRVRLLRNGLRYLAAQHSPLPDEQNRCGAVLIQEPKIYHSHTSNL